MRCRCCDRGRSEAISLKLTADNIVQGCEESIVFTAVAVWARCEAACRVSGSSGSADGNSPNAGSHSSAGMNGSSDGSADGGTGGAHPDPDPALDQLLPLVRFALMTDEELAALAVHPLRYSSTVLSDLLTEAQLCHQVEESRQQPSCAAECAQVCRLVLPYTNIHTSPQCQMLTPAI